MRHAVAAAAALGVVLFVAVACGGDPCGKNPAGSSCPETVTVSLTASVDHLKVQDTATFVGTAVHSRSGSVPVTQWSSDNAQVATVDPTTGKVTAIAPGKATIIGEHDGQRATRLVHVVPDFQGIWDGDYLVTSCSDTGGFLAEGFCQEFPVNLALPIAAVLTQTGDAPQGSVLFGDLPATMRGAVDDANVLSFEDATITAEGVTIRIISMKLTLDGTNRLQGTFRTNWTHPSLTGRGEFDGRLNGVSRVSTTVAPAVTRHVVARTWRDLAAALKSR